jgi:hypothetical protein
LLYFAAALGAGWALVLGCPREGSPIWRSSWTTCLEHPVVVGGCVGDDLKWVPVLDDLAVMVEADDVDAGLLVIVTNKINSRITDLTIASPAVGSGSPARLSRWVNAAATRPRTLTCLMPCGPVRVNSACVSMNVRASFTAAWCARSMAAATARSATAHNVDTDFTGENVKS